MFLVRHIIGLVLLAALRLHEKVNRLINQGNICLLYTSTVALAFATFENVCYLIQNGADRFSFIFFRGFGTGAMHVLWCLIVGGGLAYAWRRTWLNIAGTCGLLGAAITFHATYNLLIAYGGAAQYIAYALPVLLEICLSSSGTISFNLLNEAT